MYGAGNIGRGFIGKTLSESGYEVCFVDVVKELVDQLNQDRIYPVKIVSNEGKEEVLVKDVRAVNGLDLDLVAEEIAEADIMATSVGVNVLPKIIKPICAGLRKRFDRSGGPLNILICENIIDGSSYLRGLIEEEMGEEYKEILDKKLGLIEASIGRMVPIMTDEMREGNILRVWVEPYDRLPVDKAAFVGNIPEINNLVPYSPFGYYIKRKLFIHNMAHSMFAYYGWQRNYRYIYECVANKEMKAKVRSAMVETKKALVKEYGVPDKEIESHIEDLLNRFSNRALGDTVARVGKDPLRKLHANDRLVGAALYCTQMGIEPLNLIDGIVIGLRYDNKEDEAAVLMQSLIKNKGIEEFLISDCKLQNEMELVKKIVKVYNL